MRISSGSLCVNWYRVPSWRASRWWKRGKAKHTHTQINYVQQKNNDFDIVIVIVTRTGSETKRKFDMFRSRVRLWPTGGNAIGSARVILLLLCLGVSFFVRSAPNTFALKSRAQTVRDTPVRYRLGWSRKLIKPDGHRSVSKYAVLNIT